MQSAIASALCLTLCLAAPTASGSASIRALATATGNGVIARHITEGPDSWAWRSSIQAPHIHTDRDVGASGTAMGFLALYEATHDRAYLEAATKAGNWLLNVAQRSGNGLRWPDFFDPKGPSDTRFESFDDGAAGVSDLLWRLGDATGIRRFHSAALAGMRWIEQRAQSAGAPCPAVACRWKYFDTAGNDYRTGMGEGMAGIVYSLDIFAERTHNRSFERYALAGAHFLERQITSQGSLPEHPGTTEYNTGFLSGAAGDAFTFLRLYKHTHDRRWLADARRLLGFVERSANRERHGLSWPIEIDPSNHDAASLKKNALKATGMEEGAAGIGWVELQAYRVTRDPHALREAERAGDWLLSTALRQRRGVAWAEDLHGDLLSTSLNNGTTGTAWFLHDLALVSGRPRYQNMALRGLSWIESVSRQGPKGIFWFEHFIDGRWFTPQDESWHWGGAGIMAFLARMDGGPVDMPGEEPAL